jgi:hypothetical protein
VQKLLNEAKLALISAPYAKLQNAAQSLKGAVTIRMDGDGGAKTCMLMAAPVIIRHKIIRPMRS